LLLAGINLADACRALHQGSAADAVLPLIGAFGTLQRDDLCYLLKLRRPALSGSLRPHLNAKIICEAPESKEERGSRRGPQAYWLFLAQSELPPPDRRRQIRALLASARTVLEQTHGDTATMAEGEATMASYPDPSPAGSFTVVPEDQSAAPPAAQSFEQLEMTLLSECGVKDDIAALPAHPVSATTSVASSGPFPVACRVTSASPSLPQRRLRMHPLPPWTPGWMFDAHEDVYRYYNRYRAAGEIFQRVTGMGVLLLSLCLYVAPGVAILVLFCLGAVLAVVGLLYLDAWIRSRLAARAFTRGRSQ
jgi:hypothetical protein